MHYLTFFSIFFIIFPNTQVFGQEVSEKSFENKSIPVPGLQKQKEVFTDHVQQDFETVHAHGLDQEEHVGNNANYDLEYRFHQLIAEFQANHTFFQQRLNNIRTQIRSYYGVVARAYSYHPTTKRREEAGSYVEYALPKFLEDFEMKYRTLEDELYSIGEWLVPIIDFIEQRYLEPPHSIQYPPFLRHRLPIKEAHSEEDKQQPEAHSYQEEDKQQPEAHSYQEEDKQQPEAHSYQEEDKRQPEAHSYQEEDHRHPCLLKETMEDQLACIELDLYQRGNDIEAQLFYLERQWPGIRDKYIVKYNIPLEPFLTPGVVIQTPQGTEYLPPSSDFLYPKQEEEPPVCCAPTEKSHSRSHDPESYRVPYPEQDYIR